MTIETDLTEKRRNSASSVDNCGQTLAKSELLYAHAGRWGRFITAHTSEGEWSLYDRHYNDGRLEGWLHDRICNSMNLDLLCTCAYTLSRHLLV